MCDDLNLKLLAKKEPMPRYEVFLDAPSVSEWRNSSENIQYHWESYIDEDTSSIQNSTQDSDIIPFPPATLAADSRRISSIYGNIIWGQDEDDPSNIESQVNIRQPREGMTWEATELYEEDTRQRTGIDLTFLRTRNMEDETYNPGASINTISYEDSGESNDSAVSDFPAFSFNLNMLTMLSSLRQWMRSVKSKTSRQVSVLLAVLEVEGPDTIRIKRGPDQGKEVSILRLLCGDDANEVAKVTAWREVADEWGGNNASSGVKRGDIILMENLQISLDPQIDARSGALALTASPYQKSKMTICYRSMPYDVGDRQFRPDLRLGVSEPSVRKVQTLVTWFERMAGLR